MSLFTVELTKTFNSQSISSIFEFLEFPYYMEDDHKTPLRNIPWGKCFILYGSTVI